jgi:hypothetical protein
MAVNLALEPCLSLAALEQGLANAFLDGSHRMTLHFAAARTAATSPLARALTRRAPGCAANDNGSETSDHVLHAALRHFAEHGLSAASDAQRKAEAAFFAGDRECYLWWLGVCRTLDKRLAGRLERKALSCNGPLL